VRLKNVDACCKFGMFRIYYVYKLRKGGDEMAYETKVLLMMVLQIVSESKTIEEAYAKIALVANVDGMTIPPLDEL